MSDIINSTIRMNNFSFRCNRMRVTETNYGRYAEFFSDCEIIDERPNSNKEKCVYWSAEARKLFNQLRAAKYIDKLLEDVLNENGFTETTIRFKLYSELRDIHRALELKLKAEKFDLSYLSVTTNKGYKISGNPSGIATSLLKELTLLSWKPIKFTANELQDYFKTNKGIKCYVDKNSKRIEITKEELWKITFAAKTSVWDTGREDANMYKTLELQRDELGNLLASRVCLMYH